MLETIKENKVRTLCNAVAAAALFVSLMQVTFFVLDGYSRIYNIAAICLALISLFYAIQYMRQHQTEDLWKVLVTYCGQLGFFALKLIDNEPLVAPRLLTVVLLLFHVSIVLSALIGARRIVDNPKWILLPFLFFFGVLLMEAGAKFLPKRAKSKPIAPSWSAAPDFQPGLGSVYRPHSELKSYYPDNPRAYFKEVISGAEKWWLHTVSGNEASLIFSQDAQVAARIDIRKAPDRNPLNIQLNVPNFKAKKKRRYRVEFRARADDPRSIIVGFARSHEPWDGLGLYKRIQLTRDWQIFKEPFSATADDRNARILFDIGESAASVELSNVHLVNLRKKKIVDPGKGLRKSFVSYRFNSTGCRGRDYAIPKPSGTTRILILGNAYALGVGVHEEDTLAYKLEQLLNEGVPGSQPPKTYEVINCGINGYTTQQERTFFEFYGAKYEPDIVILVMTAEDQVADMKVFPLRRTLFMSWTRLFDSENRRILPSFSRSVPEIFQLDAEIRKRGARPVVVLFRINGDKDGSSQEGRIWNDLTRTVTSGLKATDIPVLDLQDALHRKNADKELLAHPKVGRHPNEIAHSIAAREIFTFLQSRKFVTPWIQSH
ncbi:SGNH/GDSL hydrolase family protein [bacterium]|nr:SGNH/GDSL hydrolase family protein [bacterium]